MDFTYLNYFRTVARLGNLSHAAKELFISQPGLSRYLSRLEQEVGIPLFQRRKGHIELNTYGKVFLSSVNRAFDELENGIEEINRLYARDQSILSIACSIEDYLTDRLNEFSPSHPEIGIRQFSLSLTEIEQQLVRENLDFAISAFPPRNPALRFEMLSQCPFVMVCHKDNPLARYSSLPLLNASGESFICETPRLNREQLVSICRKCGFTPTVNHEVESGYILYNLLSANTGVSLIPFAHYHKIRNLLPNSDIHAVFLEDDLPLAQIGITYYPKHIRTTAADCFLSFLHESAKKESEDFNL